MRIFVQHALTSQENDASGSQRACVELIHYHMEGFCLPDSSPPYSPLLATARTSTCDLCVLEESNTNC